MSEFSTSIPKRCHRCGEIKPAADFHRDPARADGRRPYCKACVKPYSAAYAQRPEVKERSREWDRANPERVRAASARWRAKNPQTTPKPLTPEQRERRLQNQRRRRGAHGARVTVNTGNAIRKALNGRKAGRRWEALVGYTLADLIAHLEALFVDGMTWANYGEWHIDHVRPIASFEITSVDCDDFRACWELANLQPLWAADNIAKGARY
jgi:hypothetical protein